MVGTLTHTGRAVKAGRSFIRRLIDLAKSTRRMDQHIRLSREARADIEWWVLHAGAWNGIAMIFSIRAAHPEVTVTSDASGNRGVAHI